LKKAHVSAPFLLVVGGAIEQQSHMMSSSPRSNLEALRAAARAGVAALDRGEFKESRNIEDLQAYLNELSEKVISKAAG
jgi:hypothetical protein